MKLLLTGATGFIGHALISRLLTYTEYQIYAAVRKLTSNIPYDVKQLKIDGISPNTEWSNILKGINCVIHTAARVHIMSDIASDPLEEFRKVNTIGTLNLARQAEKSGVKRFIYLSSIKVNGESTLDGFPFTEDDVFVPDDPYALSKYEAEKGLMQLAQETQMEVVIIRPPLVYGPGVKANFLSMMKWLYKGIFLPFGGIHNRRSFVGLDNLIDMIVTCIDHPAAANEIFLVSDDDDMSTTELLKRVASALGKKVYLLPIHQKILEFFLSLVGRRNISQRFFSSLEVDISKAKKILNWTPPVNVDEGLRRTAEYYIKLETQ